MRDDRSRLYSVRAAYTGTHNGSRVAGRGSRLVGLGLEGLVRWGVEAVWVGGLEEGIGEALEEGEGVGIGEDSEGAEEEGWGEGWERMEVTKEWRR